MANSCCEFWACENGVALATCGGCNTGNYSMGTSDPLAPIDPCAPFQPQLIYNDAILCDHTWYTHAVDENCQNHNTMMLFITPTIDIVINSYQNEELYDTVNAPAGIETQESNNTSNKFHYEFIPGTADDEDVITESGETGFVDIKIMFFEIG